MQRTVADLGSQHEELATMLRALDGEGWARPSACEGWTVADVVLHLAQTDEMALASVRGDFAETAARLGEGLAPVADVDELAAAMVDAERGAGPADVYARWHASAAELRARLARCEASARVPWVAGDLSARTLATTRMTETWIHTLDVAPAIGVDPPPTARLHDVARLAWRTLPYAFSQAGRTLAGPVAFELAGPAGEPWSFTSGEPAATTVRGDALELCLVAARRREPATTELVAEGPDAEAVLALVRTFA